MLSTKDKIYQSALELFASQGIQSTSTAQISKKAGVASGTLFVHFKSKQELIDTIYISIKKNAFSDLNENMPDNSSVELQFKEASRKIIEYFLTNYNEFIFLGLVDIDPMVSEEARAIGFKNFEKSMTDMKLFFKEGYFRDIDFDLLFQISWSATETIIKNLKLRNLSKPSESELNVIWDIMKKSSSELFIKIYGAERETRTLTSCDTGT